MKEITEVMYCERCQRETTHEIQESALAIDFRCTECNVETEEVKTFF